MMLLAALVAAPITAEAWEAPQGTTQPSPRDCEIVYEGIPAKGPRLVIYQAGATIRCIRTGNTAPYGGGSAYSVSDPVPDGTPCQILYYAPVTFQNLPTYIHGTWKPPAGGDGSVRIDPNSSGSVVSAAGVLAATYDVFVLYVQRGSSQGGQCQASGGWQDFCQLGTIAMPNPDPCILAQPHRITRAESPPPPVGPYIARVIAELKAQTGTMNSLPSPNGLVNLPTCFWLDGIGVPDERDLTMVLPGPPDGSNRRIYYTYLVRIFFAGVDWNFDDPYGNDQVQPHPACGQHPQITAHSYQMISEKHSPDGFYHVAATEKYQVTVEIYWDDSYGPHHSAIDPGVPLPITISPPGPYNQYVGQVEAIPIGR